MQGFRLLLIPRVLLLDGSGPSTDAELQLHVPASSGIGQPVPHPHCSEGQYCWRHHGSSQEV